MSSARANKSLTHCLLPLLFATVLAAAPFAHADDDHYIMPPLKPKAPFRGQPTNEPPPVQKLPLTDHHKQPPTGLKLPVEEAMPEETSYKKPSVGHNWPPSVHKPPVLEEAVPDQLADKKRTCDHSPPPPPDIVPVEEAMPEETSYKKPPAEDAVPNQLADKKRPGNPSPPPPDIPPGSSPGLGYRISPVLFDEK